MPRRSPRSIAVAIAVAIAATLALPGCEGQGTKIAPPPLAVFVPDVPAPEDLSVTLQPGAADLVTFDLRVSAKGVPDLFGAAFWIKYDTTKVVYAGYDATGSVLSSDGAPVQVLVDAATSPGTIKVGISRVQDQGETVQGVDVTDPADVIVIRMLADLGISEVTIQFDAAQSELINSRPSPDNVISATWAGGSVTVQ